LAIVVGPTLKFIPLGIFSEQDQSAGV